MYVKYPKAPGAADIINILKLKGVPIHTSYNINDLLNSKHGPFNILIIPGGTAKKQQSDLTEKGCEIIKFFVSSGGGYVGFCAGAYLASLPPKHNLNQNYPGIGLIKTEYLLPNTKMELKGKIDLQINQPSLARNHSKVIKNNNDYNSSNDHCTLSMNYHNGAFFEISDNKESSSDADNNEDNNDITVIGHVTELYGINLRTMIGKAAIIKSSYGCGSVVLCGPHPETTEGLEQFTFNLIMEAAPKPK
ncbi:unnamed protein product [Didymodactylos carnosus]|uniref:Biotin-protein ligase N-terminal domain-containing protein n=1 Tax=Didymodactylos carnosus TaxID=1234261 RepID=A0A814L8U7_9BILA|nr:unnamed protein product [Didymodactylos carnosus]CAF1061784.1 unnamed protein product [Didymodactylos carnosus]CAF3791663.1 unnamed protein product [Didymodactylos carnosus]CAF3830005.1 unnamed protein product [Didymodactylos carnosus]